MSRLSPRTVDIVRNAYNQAARDRQDAEEYVATCEARLHAARRGLADTREVEVELARTLDAHARAIADEEAANAAERAQREKEWRRAGIAGVLVGEGVDPEEAAQITDRVAAARNAESSEPLRGKETEGPAAGGIPEPRSEA